MIHSLFYARAQAAPTACHRARCHDLCERFQLFEPEPYVHSGHVTPLDGAEQQGTLGGPVKESRGLNPMLIFTASLVLAGRQRVRKLRRCALLSSRRTK